MTRNVDIGARRLVSLAPTAWARWLTGDETVESLDLLSGEFQWVGRSNDVLLKVESATHGLFLIVNEIQFRADNRMSKRMRAYSALAEERYDLPIYPVVINILPPALSSPVQAYHIEFMGLVAHQDYRVINLWDVDVRLALEQRISTLLPFVPVLKNGGAESAVIQARNLLRADENLAELEPLLAFLSTFILESEIVRRIMRWDMAVLRESPWYNEILQEGERVAAIRMLLHALHRRLGTVPYGVTEAVSKLTNDQIKELFDIALETDSWADIESFLADLPTANSIPSSN
jgi:predicted transposase YdaD